MTADDSRTGEYRFALPSICLSLSLPVHVKLYIPLSQIHTLDLCIWRHK